MDRDTRTKAVQAEYDSLEQEARALSKERGIPFEDALELVGQKKQNLVRRAESKVGLARHAASEDPILSPEADRARRLKDLVNSKEAAKAAAVEPEVPGKLAALQKKAAPALSPGEISPAAERAGLAAGEDVAKKEVGAATKGLGWKGKLAALGAAALGGKYLLDSETKEPAPAPKTETPAPAPEKKAAPVPSAKGAEAQPPKESAGISMAEIKRMRDAMAPEKMDLPPDKTAEYRAEFDKLDKAYQSALAEYKQQKNEMRIAQLGQMFSNALVQLAAGAYGLKHNVDLSSIRGSEWNWKQEFDNILDEMRLKAENIKEKRGILEKERSEYEGARRQAQRDDAAYRRAEASDITRLAISDRLAAARERAGRKDADARTKKEFTLAFVKNTMDDLNKQESALNVASQKLSAVKDDNITTKDAIGILAASGVDLDKVPVEQHFFGKDTVSPQDLMRVLNQKTTAIHARKKEANALLKAEMGGEETQLPRTRIVNGVEWELGPDGKYYKK